MAELNTIASSLLLSSESRAFSFSICSDSLLSCSISFSSCFVRSLEALICLSMSGLCRQLSVCKNKRHRGNDEPHAPLLLELEADACREGDVVIGAEQGDQGNHKAGMGLDDSLAIQGRRCCGSDPSSKTGADSVGGATCDKAEGRTELCYSTEELHHAMRAFSKAEAQSAARAVPNSARPAQKPCRTREPWYEPSGAHEAAGPSAAAGNVQLQAAALLASLQATLHSFAGNDLRHQPTTCAAGGAPEAHSQGIANQLAAFPRAGRRRGIRLDLDATASQGDAG